MHSDAISDSSRHFRQLLSSVFASVLRLKHKCSQELSIRLHSGVINDSSPFELALFLVKLFVLTVRGKLFYSKLARGKRELIID